MRRNRAVHFGRATSLARPARRFTVLAVSTLTILGAGGIAGAGGLDLLAADDPEVPGASDPLAGGSDVVAAGDVTAATELPELETDTRVRVPRPAPTPERAERTAATVQRTWTGVASWYGAAFAGRTAADGSTFDPNELTAAHKQLPFGSMVRVTNPRTGQSVVVEITDRGPFIAGREIDLSRAAADAIGLRSRGHGTVTLELL
ncbi:MAG: septal ring lytic transglycosylase RlpA family protein [Actinomycetes bacterium]